MRMKESIDSQYTMMGQMLQEVEHHPYLRFELANDLSWSHHVNNCTNKARGFLNFLRRNTSTCLAVTNETANTGMVRLHVEYTSSAWDSYQNNQIHKVERVQSKAIRFFLNQYDSLASVTQMGYQLRWPTLQTHGFTARMVMFYKVVYQHITLPLPDYVTPKSRTLRGEYGYHYTTVPTRTDVFKFSYFPRTVKCWNILPAPLVLKTSAEAFKNRLQRALDEWLVCLGHSGGIYDRLRLENTNKV